MNIITNKCIHSLFSVTLTQLFTFSFCPLFVLVLLMPLLWSKLSTNQMATLGSGVGKCDNYHRRLLSYILVAFCSSWASVSCLQFIWQSLFHNSGIKSTSTNRRRRPQLGGSASGVGKCDTTCSYHRRLLLSSRAHKNGRLECNFVNLELGGIIELLLKIVTCTCALCVDIGRCC